MSRLGRYPARTTRRPIQWWKGDIDTMEGRKRTRVLLPPIVRTKPPLPRIGDLVPYTVPLDRRYLASSALREDGILTKNITKVGCCTYRDWNIRLEELKEELAYYSPTFLKKDIVYCADAMTCEKDILFLTKEYRENLFNCKGDRPTADHANNFKRLTEYRNISFTKIIETINAYFKRVYPAPLLRHTDGQTLECVYVVEFELHATPNMFMGNTWFKRE